jgi:hypothetical protein
VDTESLAEHVLVGLERDVTDEKGVGLWVLGVTVGLGAGVGAVLWCGVVTGSGEVNVGLATIDESTLLGLEGSGGIGRVGELNVTETLGAARLAVGDDASASDLSELLKLAVQPLVINVPAQVTNEQVLGSGILDLSLGLLGGGLLLLIISLALLGWGGLLGALLLLGVVGVVRVLLLVAVGRIGTRLLH